ncbi:MAG: DUF1236 domain-containing protein [Stellaceae bacterium]
MKWPVLAAGLLVLAGPAMAQTVTRTTTHTTVTKKTVITPTERTEIHRYVTEQHVHPVPPPPGFTAAPGAVLPGTVTLYSFPPSAPYHSYRYAMIGGETVVVNPVTHRVIGVIH